MITLEDTAARRPEPPRDRFGRYLIDGKPWQRVTTLAKMLDDTSSLADWKARMTALGLAQRPDLFAQVATCSVDDRKGLNALVEQAKEAAGASAKANLGTALHAMCEQVDLGADPSTILPQWRADVDAYVAATDHIRWSHVEAIVVNRALGVAGTTDRIGVTGQRSVVADIKTGSLDYAALAIAIQIAAYAHADEVFDATTGELTPMPDVDRETGLIIHLPAGEGRCSLYEVDLVEGWKLAQLAVEVRDARSRGKRKGALLRPAPERAATSDEPRHVSESVADVFAGLPRADDKPFDSRPERKPAPQRIEPVAVAADDALNGGEGPWATARQVDAIMDRLKALDSTAPQAFALLQDIARRANADRPDVVGLSVSRRPSQRRVAIWRGLLALAEHFLDELEDTHLRCIGLVIPDAAQLAMPIHAALLALTTAEAEQFRRVCLAVVDTTLELTFADDGAPIWRGDVATLATVTAA